MDSTLENRLLFEHRAEEGPILLCAAGLHGNEPMPLEALKSVVDRLSGVSLNGTMGAYVANLSALAQGVRYCDTDLNRLWSRERMALLEEHPGDSRSSRGTIEEREQEALFPLLYRHLAEAEQSGRQLVLLDLHTSSGPGAPFAILPGGGAILPGGVGVDAARLLGEALPLTLVELPGDAPFPSTLASWCARRGHAALTVEGGQHNSEEAKVALETLLLYTLEHLGLVASGAFGPVAALRQRLEERRNGVPKRVQVSYVHRISEADEFRMLPGFRHFLPIRQGQEVGRDRNGPVLSPEDGFMLMPLYQARGEEGFFLTKPL